MPNGDHSSHESCGQIEGGTLQGVATAVLEELILDKGIGEPPTISAGSAVVAAIRDATGGHLFRVPIPPTPRTLLIAEAAGGSLAHI